MGFQAPEYTLELDGPDPSSHTVKELSEDIFPEAPEDASHLTSQEIRGMIVRELRSEAPSRSRSRESDFSWTVSGLHVCT